MSEQLKPCPFCGGDAIQWRRFSSIMACCAESTCPGNGCVCTVEEWNTRAPDATLSAEVERLRGELDAAIMEVSRQAAARGRAEGALATSETAGVVEGWRARAEAAEAEVERLRNEADSEFVAAAVRVMRASPGFDLRDYQDGITADDFEMFFTEDMNEAWRLHEKERARAEAAEARVAVLTYERDKARRYCSVAAYDMAGFAETLKEKPEAFPRTTHDLMETSEFMALAAEGREDGTVYDDELSKEKARVAVLEEALSNVLPPSRGIHGGPLIQMVATYEDGTDEDSARHKGRISPEAISRARAALSHTKEEVND